MTYTGAKKRRVAGWVAGVAGVIINDDYFG